MYFENSQPILRVENMDAAVAFYTSVLGFTNAPWGTDDFTSVNRDRAGIYLCRGSQGRGGAWVWLGIDDVTVLHNELVHRGVPVMLPPTNFPWALEMHLQDPDGNVLRIGSEPK
jgi:predicted enzyme related to lactoylglutathione lyase